MEFSDDSSASLVRSPEFFSKSAIAVTLPLQAALNSNSLPCPMPAALHLFSRSPYVCSSSCILLSQCAAICSLLSCDLHSIRTDCSLNSQYSSSSAKDCVPCARTGTTASADVELGFTLQLLFCVCSLE